MSTARKHEFISVRDYLTDEELSDQRHEYVAGIVYAQAGGTNRHNAIATNATVALANRLRGTACRAFNSNTKVRIRNATGTRFYYPDAMVVCRSTPPGDSHQDEPVLIVEVISETTRRIDEGEKREVYLETPSLAGYVLVEQSSPLAVVYQRGRQVGGDQGFQRSIASGLDGVIQIDEMPLGLTLREFYEDVELGEPDSPDRS
ncbi:Uma2 family endonuclease [Stieleria sp. ICT_E10.1]|uniref:Uma2 family endonuclease n=1 Tax=Stieleria sedimenti TaxID=2976331 RepID=UPI00217FC41F|nr:Uma2 family endonuclease [Stieleria sedimenti]MCS7468249.1 Uma2 family endonuclease [Stieleria sedimenti]